MNRSLTALAILSVFVLFATVPPVGIMAAMVWATVHISSKRRYKVRMAAAAGEHRRIYGF